MSKESRRIHFYNHKLCTRAIAQRRRDLVRALLGRPQPCARFVVDASGTAELQRTYPHGIPWIVFQCLRILTLQISEEMLEKLFGDDEYAYDERQWWQSNGRVDWNRLSCEDIEELVRAAADQLEEAGVKLLCEHMFETHTDVITTIKQYWSKLEKAHHDICCPGTHGELLMDEKALAKEQLSTLPAILRHCSASAE